MKILWVSPTPSHPQNAGNRAHIFAMAQEILKAGHHVTFLLYGQEQVTESSLEAMRAFWPEFFFVPHKIRDRKKTKGTHWGIDDWFNEDIAASLRFLREQRQFDAVYCEYVFFSKSLTFFGKDVLKILNCHDRMSDRAELLTRNGIEPDFFYTTEEQEKIALDRADLVLAIQEEEKNFYQTLSKKCVIEVGYPVELNILPPQEVVFPLRVGYLGSNNSLNRKSINSFLDAVRERPGLEDKIQIVLAGTICNAIDDPQIETLGVIDSEEEFYQEIDLAINPMVDGTGLKIKTLSAIRHGIPFLSTITGSVGIPVRLAEHQCQTVDEMVEYLETISNTPGNLLCELREESLHLLEAYQKRQQQQIGDLLRAISTRSIRHVRHKRVLVVTDVAFWEPGVGSHARILELCKTLKEHFDLQIFFFGSLWAERNTAIDRAGFAGLVTSYKQYEAKSTATPIHSTFPKLDGLKRWRHDIFAKTLKTYLASAQRFDAIIFEYLWLAYTRDALTYPALTVLDTHDLMAPREYRYVSQGLPHHISISSFHELEILDRFGAVIAIQHEEARQLTRSLCRALPLCCPHGIETKPLPASRRVGSDYLRLGFVGTSSDANVEAIKWFLQQVWPVLCCLPIEVHVYGRVCDRISPPPGGVTLHGLVDPLDAAYRACDVMINPVIHGGGIKIKSVESLVHGKPLIASPEGAVGIENPEESGVIVARTRGEFIDAVLLLLRDPDRRRTMAEAAQMAAEAQFSPQRCFGPLIEMIEAV